MLNSQISIPVNQPFPWRQTLAYLYWRGTPGLDVIEEDRYTRRTANGPVTVHYDPTQASLICDAQEAGRVRTLFDTGCDISAIESAFAGCPVLGPRLQQVPGLRIPGCWEPFELCLRVILGQQVSVKAAATFMRRLAEVSPNFVPEEIAKSNLNSVRIPQRRIDTLRSVAHAVAAGELNLRSWKEAAVILQKIPGIGPWTIDYLAIRLGRDCDAFPQSDLGLLRAAGFADPRALLHRAEQWRPYRAYAAMYLWAVQHDVIGLES
ncbi:MAG: AlkA N-terminal domain-containing protein [Bryobacteraceae bacterium]